MKLNADDDANADMKKFQNELFAISQREQLFQPLLSLL